MVAFERGTGRKACAQITEPSMIGGRCFAFCASVPNSIKIGPM